MSMDGLSSPSGAHPATVILTLDVSSTQSLTATSSSPAAMQLPVTYLATHWNKTLLARLPSQAEAGLHVPNAAAAVQEVSRASLLLAEAGRRLTTLQLHDPALIDPARLISWGRAGIRVIGVPAARGPRGWQHARPAELRHSICQLSPSWDSSAPQGWSWRSPAAQFARLLRRHPHHPLPVWIHISGAGETAAVDLLTAVAEARESGAARLLTLQQFAQTRAQQSEKTSARSILRAA